MTVVFLTMLGSLFSVWRALMIKMMPGSGSLAVLNPLKRPYSFLSRTIPNFDGSALVTLMYDSDLDTIVN